MAFFLSNIFKDVSCNCSAKLTFPRFIPTDGLKGRFSSSTPHSEPKIQSGSSVVEGLCMDGFLVIEGRGETVEGLEEGGGGGCGFGFEI